ncbi:unnamed protein product [Acidithrix sp. C25]|nr:unnamed protein product [Acidithrix sp. C25]
MTLIVHQFRINYLKLIKEFLIVRNIIIRRPLFRKAANS